MVIKIANNERVFKTWIDSLCVVYDSDQCYFYNNRRMYHETDPHNRDTLIQIKI